MNILECARLIEQQFLNSELFFGHGQDNAFDEAVWLIMSVTNLDNQFIDWELILTPSQTSAVRKLADKRIKSRIPLPYLLNRAWFAEHEFYIDQRAIIPRSYIGEWIPDRFEPWLSGVCVRTILDLCTGSGCIAIASALAFPEAVIDAVDISLDALDVAKINTANFGLNQRVRLWQGDLFDGIPHGTQYDVILCNPPYVNNDVMESLPPEYTFEPKSALAGGSDGLVFIRRILNSSRRYLNSEGSIFLEVGSAAEAVEKTWSKVPFTWLTSFTGESPVLLMTAELLDHYKEYFDIAVDC